MQKVIIIDNFVNLQRSRQSKIIDKYVKIPYTEGQL